MSKDKIGVIGSGLIGRSWAMLFASAGYEVSLYDTIASQVSAALEDIAVQLKKLEELGTLKGSLSAGEQLMLIKGVHSMKECMTGALHVIESVPENLDIKKQVFLEMDKFADPDTVLGSSTSALMPSLFTEGLVHKANCIVTHPVNPPYYVPLVEIVPAPWTSREVVARTRQLMKEIGQAPVTFSKEILGFGLNRIQYAILNECWYLVKEGVLSVQDVDTLMTEGLAMRYAWLGPLEVCHLNAEGMKEYIEKYGSTIHKCGGDLGPLPSWSVEDGQEICGELEKLVPVDKLQEKRSWRDTRIMALAKLKRDMQQK